jgi:hypothetical protein
MLKRFLPSFQSVLFIGLTLLLVACAGNQQKAKENETISESSEFDEAHDRIVNDIARIAAELPPPSLIPNSLKSIGATFHSEVINDLSKLESYQIDDDKAALNLGIYATDIAYLITYDKVVETEEHMEACRLLGESLGVSTVFDQELVKKYEAAMNNSDSLNALMNRTIKIAEDRLEHSERLAMSALVLTGSFIEGLFLAIEVVKTFPEHTMTEEKRDKLLEPLVQLVLDQKHTLEDVTDMLRDIPQDDNISRMIVELSILTRLYEGDLADIAAKMELKPEGFVVTSDMLLDINIEVIRIREEIVQ